MPLNKDMSSGFLVIDKPLGVTSHDVVAQLRRQLNTKKIGHAGTLDPMASGVLVCAVGEGLKFLEYITSETSKSYVATVKLGSVSDTYDQEGDIKENAVTTWPSLEKVERILQQKFTGPIKQVPPIYSSIKIKGKRAYEYARQGQELELPTRDVEVKAISIKKYNPPELILELEVSKGFYVRSLAHDLGQVLGVGAYLTALRRTSVGGFDIDQSVTIDNLTEESILPLELLLPLFIKREVNESEQHDLQMGHPIKRDMKTNQLAVAVYQDKIISILKPSPEGQWSIRKNLNV